MLKNKKMTVMKIKGLHYESVRNLAFIALQACPKLIHLEIVEIPLCMGTAILVIIVIGVS